MRIKTISTTLKVVASVLTASIGGLSFGTIAYSTKQYNELDSRYEQQQTVNDLYSEENHKLNKDISALNQRIEELEEMLESSQEDYVVLNEKKKSIEKEYKIIQEALFLMMDENDALTQQYKGLAKKYEDLQKQYNELINPSPVVPSTEVNNVQKIVLMIGDGMGEVNIECAKEYLDIGETLKMTELTYTGSADTRALNSGTLPDSAAGGSALATGTRVHTTKLSITEDNVPIETIAEIARDQGWGVGIVTSDHLQEATPAAFSAHTDSRKNFVDIRKSQYESNFDLFLGSDVYYENMIMDSQDYCVKVDSPESGVAYESGYVYDNEKQKIIDAGYTFIQDFNFSTVVENNLLQEDKVFGAFPEISLSHFRAPQKNNKKNYAPCLSQLTQFAMEWMELHFPNGYFLMIEENNIDVYAEGHTGSEDAKDDTGEMVEAIYELDRCVGIVKDVLEKSGSSYVIAVSADHSTGALCESDNREGNYRFWANGHDYNNVPYYIETKGTGCDLGTNILNIDICNFLKRTMVLEPQ